MEWRVRYQDQPQQNVLEYHERNKMYVICHTHIYIALDFMVTYVELHGDHFASTQLEGILAKGPYLPCVSMAGRALLAGYPRTFLSFLSG